MFYYSIVSVNGVGNQLMIPIFTRRQLMYVDLPEVWRPVHRLCFFTKQYSTHYQVFIDIFIVTWRLSWEHARSSLHCDC